jgi:hypothetical protein
MCPRKACLKLHKVDEHWLDHEGNIVDEQRVIETLEAASGRGDQRLERCPFD